MTDMDAFERHVAETLRWYADDVTPGMDAVDVAHRVALAHPRRRKGAIAWRLGALPRLGAPLRLAWLLLLLAGLLAVMVGGMLITGSQPVDRLSTVLPPVGQVFECPPGSTPDEPGPVGQARPPVHTGEAMAFERRAGKLIALAGDEDGAETWTFDVCTNTWTRMHPDAEPPSVDYWLRLVYDADSDVTLGVFSGTVFAYDLETDTWTEKGVAPPDAEFWAHDAGSGLVFAADRSDPPALWEYDTEADTWIPLQQSNGPAYGAAFTYDASVDRMVAYTRGENSAAAQTWLFDIRAGTWMKSNARTPFVGVPMHLTWFIDYDEAAERTVVMGGSNLAAYDAAVDRWEFLRGKEWPDGPMFLWGAAYDVVNGRLVGGGQADDMLAFDTQTHEWTTLLASSHR